LLHGAAGRSGCKIQHTPPQGDWLSGPMSLLKSE